MIPVLHVLAVALLEEDLAALRALVRRTVRPEARTLDLGCGPGLLADIFERGDYVGVDPRAVFVEYARRRRPGAFLCEELERIDLPDRRFEQAVALDVFGARGDAAGRRIAGELRRLVGEGGRALIIERRRAAPRVEPLLSSLGRLERREALRSGFRKRVAFLVSTAS